MTAKTYFVAQVPKLLDARNLCLTLGGVQAVVSFSLSMDRGEIVAVAGPGGAGKSSLLDLLCGLRVPASGLLQIGHRPMGGRTVIDFVRAGVVRCFQQPRLLWDRGALENVRIALRPRYGEGLIGTLLRTPAFHRAQARSAERAMELLAAVGLADDAHALAGDLDLDRRKRLEIARALATEPAFLLLDEPAAGMDARQKERLAGLIGSIGPRFNAGVCFTDDAPDLAFACADHLIVLNHGHTIAAGPPAELRQDPAAMAVFGRQPDEE